MAAFEIYDRRFQDLIPGNALLEKLSKKYGVVRYRGPDKTPVTITAAESAADLQAVAGS